MYISIELTKEQQDHFERMAREVDEACAALNELKDRHTAELVKLSPLQVGDRARSSRGIVYEICGVKPSSFDGNVSFSFDGKVSFSYEGFKIKKDGTPGAVSGFVSSSNLEKVS